jgi:hypothetical protein
MADGRQKIEAKKQGDEEAKTEDCHSHRFFSFLTFVFIRLLLGGMVVLNR